MATVTKSIGTSSRDYSTITLWEADLDDPLIYSSGDDAVGECYNDSAFSGAVTVNGGSTVGLGSVTLSVANTERHDGSAGSGSVTSGLIFFSNGARVYTVEWLEIKDTTGGISQNQNTTNKVLVARNNIVHNIYHNNSTHVAGIGTVVGGGDAYNNIIYDIENGTGGAARKASGFNLKTGGGIQNWAVYNNTVYNTKVSNATDGLVYSYHFGDYSQYTLKNNIGIGVSVTGSTTATELKGFYTDSASYATLSNNLSSDSTASGTGSLTGKTAANQFVSTLSGSEDLHIVETSDAFGAGVDLGTVVDGVQYDIDGQNRDTFIGTTWDIGADQVKTPASIGTSSRDYSTIALWEADLDDTSLYTSGDDAVGECYNDSNFTASTTINGGGTVGLSSRTLTVHPDHRHDGTVGTGAHVTYSATGSSPAFQLSIANTLVEWFSVKLNGTGNYGNSAIVNHAHNINYTTSRYIVGEGDTTDRINSPANGILVYGNYTKSYNNIIYNYMMANATSAGIYDHYGSSHEVYNNTVYNCPYGYSWTTSGNTTMKNNLVVGSYYVDFIKGSNAGTVVSSNNLSSDSTATINGGSNHVTGAPVSRQFVSTLSGSEDLHLIFKSAAIDAGVDLGTTPDGVQYDINGKDRDTENSIWDIGAHEYGDNVVFGLLRV